MAIMRFNRWLSSSSFSRRFFEEDLEGPGSVAIVSVSSRAPISSRVLKADYDGLGSALREMMLQALSHLPHAASIPQVLFDARGIDYEELSHNERASPCRQSAAPLGATSSGQGFFCFTPYDQATRS